MKEWGGALGLGVCELVGLGFFRAAVEEGIGFDRECSPTQAWIPVKRTACARNHTSILLDFSGIVFFPRTACYVVTKTRVSLHRAWCALQALHFERGANGATVGL